MRIIKEFFARIWALWGIITFVVTFLIVFLPSMVSYLFKNEKKGQEYFIFVSRIWMNIWLILIGCPARIYGREYFEKGKVYVVTFNHNAFLDVPLSAPYVPGANKTIAKASFAKVPLFGWFYKKGSVLVDRKKEDSRVKSFEAMKIVLRKGMHMCIYPEGTRNRTDKPMKEFYEGAFKLAADTGTDIMPCIITGTRMAMPIHKTFYLLPQRLSMRFLPPVPASGKSGRILKEEVYGVMLAEITKN